VPETYRVVWIGYRVTAVRFGTTPVETRWPERISPRRGDRGGRRVSPGAGPTARRRGLWSPEPARGGAEALQEISCL